MNADEYRIVNWSGDWGSLNCVQECCQTGRAGGSEESGQNWHFRAPEGGAKVRLRQTFVLLSKP